MEQDRWASRSATKLRTVSAPNCRRHPVRWNQSLSVGACSAYVRRARNLSFLTSSVDKICSACLFGNQNRQFERYRQLVDILWTKFAEYRP